MDLKKECPVCHMSSEVVYVHGHGQCSLCKTNIEPCCSGDCSEDFLLPEWNQTARLAQG
ncbi:hypothetical protein [Leptospira adleri]|uniref:hypothetical protein n=1 Tax=Leptospira adleri TaxID=2023186 RepID=UPI0013FD7A67|nr:hypothetical protein [Leptospira adleri]